MQDNPKKYVEFWREIERELEKKFISMASFLDKRVSDRGRGDAP